MTKMVKYEDLNGPRWNPFDFRLKIGKKWWSSTQFQKGFTPLRLEGHFWPFRPFGRKNCQNAWFASQINDFLYYSCIFPFLALFCHLLYVLLTMSSPPPQVLCLPLRLRLYLHLLRILILLYWVVVIWRLRLQGLKWLPPILTCRPWLPWWGPCCWTRCWWLELP